MEKIETGLKSLDELLGGGIPKGKLLCFYGIPQIGKSWLARQILFSASRFNVKSLYIDTESELDKDFWSFLVDVFKKRWKDAKPDLVSWRIIPDIFELGRLFGIQFTLSYSKERVTVLHQYPKREHGEDIESSEKGRNWIEYAPIKKQVDDGLSLLIVDSLSGPIKPEIPSATQNFGARASVQRPLLASFQKLNELGVTVIFTTHASRNPQEQYSYVSWGGDDIVYYSKFIYALLPPLKADKQAFGPEARRVKRVRHPGKVEDVRTVVLQKDYGFISAEEYKP